MKRIVMLLAALAAAPSFAQDMYVTGAVGQAEQKFSNEGGSVKDDDTGYSAAFGFRIDPNFAVEAGYANLGEVGYSDADQSFSSKPKAFYGAVVGTFPVTPEFSLSAKVGISRNSTTLSASDGVDSGSEKFKKTSALFGVGAAYAVSPTVAIVAEYQNFGKVIDEQEGNVKASMLSIGARFAF